MQDYEQIITLIISAALSCASLYFAFYSLLKARMIENVPTSKIRSAAQGYVELNGNSTYIDKTPVLAPLTGQPCLWYTYKIEHYRRKGEKSSWVTVEKKTSDKMFLLKDGTGECSIDPRNADITGFRSTKWYGTSRRPAHDSWKNGSRRPDQFSLDQYRYTEKILYEGSYLYTLGFFQTIHVPSVEQATKDRTVDILNMWKEDYDALVKKFDTNGDGEIDMQEWESARREAAIKAKQYAIDNYDATPINILCKPPDIRRPYLISTYDPKKLSGRYRLYALGFALGFIAAAVFTVYFVRQFDV